MTSLHVLDGPRLLAGYAEGPGLPVHLNRHGSLPRPDASSLRRTAALARLRGRGGAGFPFATKLAAALETRARRREVVVNWSEGEPASWKDAALALGRPHLVLDGAAMTALALGSREVHVVVPGEHRPVVDAVRRAVAERPERLAWRIHEAQDRFVAGQSRAVLELLAGRPGLPVTAWAPEAISGHRGRPTLLSNAETWAQLALLVRDPAAPVTALLTLDGEAARPYVVEAVDGTPWSDLLAPGPHLVGGYHGVWVDAERMALLTASRDLMARAGAPLGAGAVLPPRPGESPLTATARIVDYLAGQSAGRCGPCRHGLPALAEQVTAYADGLDVRDRIAELSGLVEGRGACAHPDGTVRLVRSLLALEDAALRPRAVAA